MSVKKGNSVLLTAESEELDYEEDDANSPVKKHAVALEKEKDLEEGEILDTNDEDYPKKRICYFFQRGECRLGDKCSGLHVTDCLYKMIDSPPAILPEFQNGFQGANPHTNNPNLLYCMVKPSAALPPTLQNACCTANLQTKISSLSNYEQCESALTAWDRALIEAKKLVKNFDKKSNRTCPPVTITIESDNEQLSNKSTKKPRRYQSPSPKKMSVRKESRDNVKKLPKRKSFDNKSDSDCANKWHDPWRRSPVHPAKSFPSSVNSVRNFGSPHCRKPGDLSVSEKRRCQKVVGNRNKGVSCRSLSSSSSSPTHRSNKERSKTQKENVSPIKITKLKPSISKHEHPEVAKKRHKTNFHRSSSSSSRASIHRSIKENLKIIQKKKTFAVGNKSDRNLKLSISDRRPREIADKWHRTVSRRSSSSSSQTSIHRSIKDSFKAIQEKKTSVGNKRDKHIKLSDRRQHRTTENGHKATSRRSSTSSSPSSVYRSREIGSKRKTDPQTSNKKISPSVLDRNSKSNEHVKVKLPSSSFGSNRQLNDVGQWTPKKVGPPTPTVKSCSDMSISPLTDSSLSDIFDPDKKENKDITYRHEVSRSRSFLPRKKYQGEVYGPICPPNNPIVAPSMSETKSKIIQNNKFAIANLSGTTKVVSNLPACGTKNKTVTVSKPKQLKNRKFSRNLEADLFKFHRDSILPDDDEQQESAEHLKPAVSNVVQEKSTETEVKKASNKNDRNQKMSKTQNNEMKRETSLIKRNPRSRKEEILQQLEAINAAIERKKTTMYVLRK